MNIYLDLVGLKIKILGYPYKELPKQFLPFISQFEDNQADIVYNTQFWDKEPKVEGKLVFKTDRHEIYRQGDVYKKVSYLGNIRDKMKYYTIFGVEHNYVDVILSPSFKDEYPLAYMSFIFFDFVILYFQRIMMHASVVLYKSNAILFTGPSGMGKSTQAGLWVKYREADILNGDRAVLHPKGEKVIVYGSPYAGSSEIYRNQSATVKAIVLLRQSKTNSIVRLSGIEAYKLLFPRFSLIRWDKDIFEESMKIVSDILESVPVYMLSCCIGKEAVDLVHKTIYEEK